MTSIFNLQSTVYPKWELMATNFNSSRAAAGLPNLNMEWYEGALEPSAPTKAQCDAIGVAVAGGLPTPGDAASAAIAAAISAWRFDVKASATLQLYYNSYMGLVAGYPTTGAQAHSLTTSNLVLTGGGIYGLTENSSLQSPGLRQTYNGFAAFSAP